MNAVLMALEALARADADVAYWMQQYKRAVEAVREWVASTPDDKCEAPRYRLLQQTLQDTRCGLDYAVRTASEARQELANARQFHWEELAANRMGTAVASAAAAPGLSSVITTAAPFRLRTSATMLPTLPMQTPLAVTSLTASSGPSSASDLDGGELHREGGRPPSAVEARAGAVDAVNASPPREAVQVPALKRSRGGALYLAPSKRAKYPKAFEWGDKTMHHFPRDFMIPICTLAAMWAYWVCGDANAKYPPFRILTAPQLEDPKTKRTLSSLRFVMLEIESRVLAQGAWVNNPSVRDAADMLAAVKDSVSVRPAAKRGELQRVEQLQWTSLGRIIRDQNKNE